VQAALYPNQQFANIIPVVSKIDYKLLNEWVSTIFLRIFPNFPIFQNFLLIFILLFKRIFWDFYIFTDFFQL
jgi:hypothetical protein